MPLLHSVGLTKRFDGLRAVDAVDLSIEQGEILGLIGPNGAGKTTFVNLLTGELPVTEGKIIYRGADITQLPPYKRNRLGLARTFQVPRPFHSMTVRENVLLSARFGKDGRPRDVAAAGRKADEILEKTGLAGVARQKTETLTTAGLKRLETARALATDPDLLFLDEPLGGLNQVEAADALTLIKALNESGTTILFIEHIIKAVSAISHRVVVLARGQKLAEGTPEVVLANEAVQRAYLGNISSAFKHNLTQHEAAPAPGSASRDARG
jgi:branched-chain amino acid transport system ATP-binding protein